MMFWVRYYLCARMIRSNRALPIVLATSSVDVVEVMKNWFSLQEENERDHYGWMEQSELACIWSALHFLWHVSKHRVSRFLLLWHQRSNRSHCVSPAERHLSHDTLNLLALEVPTWHFAIVDLALIVSSVLKAALSLDFGTRNGYLGFSFTFSTLELKTILCTAH